MPIIFTDQFWVIDPFNPPPPGTLLTAQNYTVRDNNNNNLVNRFSNDSIDGVDIRASYSGDTVTVALLGGGTTTITGATFYLADGRQVFTPTDGSFLPTGSLISTSWVSGQSSVPSAAFGPPCFTPGTLISTAAGPMKVEDLCYGDLILTADKGLVPLVFAHERFLDADHLLDNPKHGPVRFLRGSLGENTPDRDLVVSPQHRMLIRSVVAEKMFGESEILVPACQLVGLPGIERVDPADGVTYIHVLLDHHAVIYAENTPTESLFLGTQVHETLSERDINVLRALLSDDWQTCMEPARLFVRGARLRTLLERLQKNQKPLVEMVPEAQQHRMAG